MSRAALRLPRRIVTGTLGRRHPGARLRFLVLGEQPDEWIGLDLDSGGFVRFDPGPQAPAAARLQVGEVVLGEDEPPDPARPERVPVGEGPNLLGRPRRRPLRRLLDALAARERPGRALLDTHGPSVPYVELDGSSPSLMLVALGRRALLVSVEGDEVYASFRWSGMEQLIAVRDAGAVAAAKAAAPRPLRRPELAALCGFDPGFVLIGLAEVRGGHVRKALLSLLPR